MSSVFILGAGASKHAGVPLMRDFLEVTEDLRRHGVGRFEKDFDLVLRGRSELQSVLSKARFDIRNLETVFAAFEMATVFGRLGSIAGSDIDKLVPAMRRVIVETIERKMLFGVHDGIHIQPTGDYQQLANAIHLMREAGESVSIITFNYDIGIDMALWTRQFVIDYCLASSDVTSASAVELMKLHGSINWAECASCGNIVVDHVRDIVAAKETDIRELGRASGPVGLPVASRLPLKNHCDALCKAEPAIVPPTVDKGGLRVALQPVWIRAADRLRDAENIFVIGYSWPDGDQFFHQLFALGTVGSSILRRVWICNPDESVRQRFKERLLGQQAAERLGPSDGAAYLFPQLIKFVVNEFGINPAMLGLNNKPRVRLS